ncbi:MAG TPA: hypothetical protein DIT32_03525 [Peptococcaceae bacterium]|nr:hypothetical protein [Peptococcaceae bacterium]
MLNLEDRIENFNILMGEHVTDEFFNWLMEYDFFTAPASANHHGNYEGGLFDHSFAVAEALVKLTKDNSLKWHLPRSPFIVGMFHDLCKIDQYKKTETGFAYNNDMLISGHGDKSVIYLQQHIKLTQEEIICIRWHMGAFDEAGNWKYYSAAVRQFENTLWTHTADMIASQIMGI